MKVAEFINLKQYNSDFKNPFLELNEKDRYWLAGLLEGDGCFTADQGYPKAILSITDLDVIEDATKIFNTSISRQKRKGRKVIYDISLLGSSALSLMKVLYPLMSQRRQKRIKELYNNWNPSCIEALNKKVLNPISNKVAESGSFIKIPEKYCDKKINLDYHIKFWLAGLIQSDGSIVSSAPSQTNRIALEIEMTDEDTIKRVATIWSKSIWKRERSGKKQTLYGTQVHGPSALYILKQIFPYVGKRRQRKIKSVYKNWDPFSREKLTPEQAKEIYKRANYTEETERKIAQDFPITGPTVNKIKHRKTWAWVTKGLDG